MTGVHRGWFPFRCRRGPSAGRRDGAGAGGGPLSGVGP
ncbi:hypothetical protein B005_3434 [Nocardiopsis alba ATCC BAA-2165]|uniref:Uncharacterized protein n=1 Tax=Nocardiopsis alba (strain ATCC BAA-2165 / BE74) TaxID=1205910 RepID=J7KWY9_NOCAA|nr:hypothetical protein B005_3434 [Nocardiopsis alba ATCC BAA-2165]